MAERLLFPAPVEGFLNLPATAFIQPFEPMLISGLEFQQIPAGVVAMADVPPVIHCSAQYNIAKLAVLYRSEAGGFQAIFEWADTECRQDQSIAVKITAGGADQPAYQGPGAQGGAECRSVDASAPMAPAPKPAPARYFLLTAQWLRVSSENRSCWLAHASSASWR